MDISDRVIVRNTFINLGGKVIPLGIGILTIPLILRGLGTERFGLLSLSWVVLGYFTIFDLGLGRATTKFVAQALGRNEKMEIVSLISSAASSQMIFGIIGAIIFYFITPFLVNGIFNIPVNLVHEASKSFHILAFSIPIIFISSSFAGVLEAYQRFDLVNLIIIPSISLNFLLPLVGVWAGLDLAGIMVLLFCSKLMVLLAYLALSLKNISGLKGRVKPSKETFRKLIAFGGWITVSNAVSPILVYIDRFFIGALLTLSAVSYYTAPSEIVTRLLIIPTSLVATLFPAFSFLSEANREHLKFLYARAIKYVILGVGPIVMLIIVFASQLLNLWLGPEFASKSSRVLQILALGVFFNSLARVPFSLLQALGRPEIMAKLHLIELPVHLALVWFLVSKFGLAGAAAAWAFRVTLDAVLLFGASIILKIFPGNLMIKTALIQIIFMSSLLLVTFFMIITLSDDWILKTIYGLFLVIAVSWIIWRYILDTNEKKFFRITFKNLMSKCKRII